MGSGCNNSQTSNYFQSLTPDSSVVYTGPQIQALGICTGDRLSEIEAVLLQKIIDYSTGSGISISNIDLSTCDAFTSCITCCNNQCRDLPCLLDCYKTAICSIWDDVATLREQVEQVLNGPYDIGCLSLSGNVTLFRIIQELILEFCALKSAVSDLQTGLATLSQSIRTQIGNFILEKLTTCQGNQTLIKSGTGASAAIEFKGFTPIGGIMPYAGPVAGKFDSTGLGLSGTDVCGFAICNGNNGTVDMREQVPVGCGAGVMGGGSLPPNADGSNYALGAQFGLAQVLLSGSQSGTASHTHTITDRGHFHNLYFQAGNRIKTDGGSYNAMGYNDALSYTGQDASGIGSFDNSNGLADIRSYIGRNTTGIEINASTGANARDAHENRQPSTALIYIQRIA